jgi:hypothetical protein
MARRLTAQAAKSATTAMVMQTGPYGGLTSVEVVLPEGEPSHAMTDESGACGPPRHGVKARHPRLAVLLKAKTWIPGLRPVDAVKRSRHARSS